MTQNRNELQVTDLRAKKAVERKAQLLVKLDQVGYTLGIQVQMKCTMSGSYFYLFVFKASMIQKYDLIILRIKKNNNSSLDDSDSLDPVRWSRCRQGLWIHTDLAQGFAPAW